MLAFDFIVYFSNFNDTPGIYNHWATVDSHWPAMVTNAPMLSTGQHKLFNIIHCQHIFLLILLTQKSSISFGIISRNILTCSQTANSLIFIRFSSKFNSAITNFAKKNSYSTASPGSYNRKPPNSTNNSRRIRKGLAILKSIRTMRQ